MKRLVLTLSALTALVAGLFGVACSPFQNSPNIDTMASEATVEVSDGVETIADSASQGAPWVTPTPQPPATPRPADTPQPAPSAGQLRTVSEGMYISSGSLDDLVANSTTIVIGTIPSSEPNTLSVDSQVSDASGPITNVQAVGSGYNVEVERYLKGSGGNTIPVVQFYGIDYTDQGQIKQARDNDADLLLSKGSRYLLFLRENRSHSGYWIGTAEPYKFLLKGGQAKVKSPLSGLGGTFPEQPESDFISSVEAKIAASP